MKKEEINLKDIWAVEQSILDEFDRVCRKHGLRYSLAYGTLLGAIRHQGFIPWDDDIDVMMPREDYERFISVWPSSGSKDFILDDCDQQLDAFNNFSKLRKDHTTFLQFEIERSRKYHKGIFIDIFPADRVAQGALSEKIQFLDFALNLLFNRGSLSGNGGIIGLTERILLKIIPQSRYHAVSLFFGRRSRRWNQNESASYVFPSTIQECRRFYPADFFDHLKPIKFQGKEYLAVEDYDMALRLEYGDYLCLPPEEERVWKHHPILVDFHHNYEELPGEKT